MKIKHYYYFDRKQAMKTLNAENWDVLRVDEKPGPFSIERTIDDYEKNCIRCVEYKKAAEIIARMWTEYRLGERLVSLGCGKGILEWHIKKLMPELYIKCTDYAKESLKLLEKVFAECNEFEAFDMLKADDYAGLKQDETLLMYRVSTEFTLEQWKEVFEKLYGGGYSEHYFCTCKDFNISYCSKREKESTC